MAANPECDSALTGMLIPIVVCHNEDTTIHSGKIVVHPAMPFRDLLSAIERNLELVFIYAKSASVISIDMVDGDTSSCTSITPVNQAFDFSSLAYKGSLCHFLVNVFSDLSWDEERGDPVIEFIEWKNWKEDNQNGDDCGRQTSPDRRSI